MCVASENQVVVRTTKVPALAPVQNGEPISVVSLTGILWSFSTVFSTVVLKTFLFALKKKSRLIGRLFKKHFSILFVRSARHFFEQLLIDIEVRVHVLYIILILESFHETDHSVGRLPFEFDVVLRNHRDTG